MTAALVIDLVFAARKRAALQVGELVDQALVVEQSGPAGSEQRQHVQINAAAVERGFQAGDADPAVRVGDPALPVIVAGDLRAAIGAQQGGDLGRHLVRIHRREALVEQIEDDVFAARVLVGDAQGVGIARAAARIVEGEIDHAILRRADDHVGVDRGF